MIWPFVFASFPFFSFYFQRKFSKNLGRLNDFKHHWIVNYADWLFVPFNLLFLYAVSIDFAYMLIAFVLALVSTIVSHNYWGHKRLDMDKCHFFVKNSSKMVMAGKVHFIFFVVQATMVIYFLLMAIFNYAFIFSAIALVLFAIGNIYGAHRMHCGIIQIRYTLLFMILITAVVGKSFLLIF